MTDPVRCTCDPGSLGDTLIHWDHCALRQMDVYYYAKLRNGTVLYWKASDPPLGPGWSGNITSFPEIDPPEA